MKKTRIGTRACILISILAGSMLLGCTKPASEPTAEVEDQPLPATENTTKTVPAESSSPPAKPVTADDFRFAAYEGDFEKVKQALDEGLNVNAPDDAQRLTALHMAAYNGHTRVVELLLEKGAEVDPRDHEGKTPLTHACTGPFQETVRALVQHGADVNVQESVEGFTPLMMAAGLGQLESVKILLENKANPSIRDHDGDRAIEHARNRGYQEIVKLLES